MKLPEVPEPHDLLRLERGEDVNLVREFGRIVRLGLAKPITAPDKGGPRIIGISMAVDVNETMHVLQFADRNHTQVVVEQLRRVQDKETELRADSRYNECFSGIQPWHQYDQNMTAADLVQAILSNSSDLFACSVAYRSDDPKHEAKLKEMLELATVNATTIAEARIKASKSVNDNARRLMAKLLEQSDVPMDDKLSDNETNQ